MSKRDFFHLTHIKNIDSILSHGILPMYITNDTHWEIFKDRGLKERKCVYTWDGEHYRNGKYIRDMIYCKFFIHPRNALFDYTNEYQNFYDYGNKIFGEDSSYILLKINHSNWIGDWIHSQTPGEGKYSTTAIMSDKYAHEDKPIYVSKEKIISFDIIEKINVRVYKNNTLGFSFLKYN